MQLTKRCYTLAPENKHIPQQADFAIGRLTRGTVALSSQYVFRVKIKFYCNKHRLVSSD